MTRWQMGALGITLALHATAANADGFMWSGHARQLATQYAESSPEQRREILARLADGGATAGPALVAALDDPDLDLQVAAALALGVARYAPAEPILARRLATAPPVLRRAILAALGVINTAPARQAALRSLGDPDADVRVAAVRALAGGPYPQPAPAFTATERESLTMRLSDEAASVRVATIEVLAQRRDNDSGRHIATRLIDSSSDVRLAAANAVAQLRVTSALPQLLLLARDSSSLPTARAAARGLAHLADANSVPALWELYRAHDRVNAEVAVALGHVAARHPDAAVAALTPFMSHVDSSIARMALSAAGSGAVPVLLAALSSRAPRDVTPIVERLTRLADPRATAAILAEANQPRVAPTHLLAALGSTRDARAVAFVAPYLADSVSDVRVAALVALGTLPAAEVNSLAPVLNGLLSDTNDAVRAAAAQRLGDIYNEPSVSPLLRLAQQDPVPHVRFAALASLAKVGGPAQVAPVLALVDQPDVGPAAGRALGAMIDATSATTVVEALTRTQTSPRAARLLRALDDLALRDPAAVPSATVPLATQWAGATSPACAEAAIFLLIHTQGEAANTSRWVHAASVDVAVAAIGGLPHTARESAVPLLDHVSDRIAAAAAWRLGQFAPSHAESHKLRALATSTRFAPAVNASAALVRWAMQGWEPQPPHAAEIAAALAGSAFPIVRAHAVRFARRTQATATLAQLASDPSPGVQAALAAGPDVPRNEWRIIDLIDRYAPTVPLRRALVFAVGSDGIAWAGWPSLANELRFAEFPSGPVTVRLATQASAY